MNGAAPFAHEPVMVAEIVAVFSTVPAGTVLDATLGGGGHAAAILDEYPALSILGIDRDEHAVAAARSRLERFGTRVTTAHRRFDGIRDVMDEHHIGGLSGALFDLGVSSPQLDHADRGFSYRNDGPLDMRMDRTQPWSASDVLNGYDEAALTRVIRRYGDERFASRIAKAIVAARQDHPIGSTTELAAIVTAAIPAAARRTGGHPAKRTFQAIRIEVNGELDVLPDAIDQAIDATVPQGRIAVLTYHSGEDRIVKERFTTASGRCDCPPGLPCVCGAAQLVRRVRSPRTPTTAQAEDNPRARSARLRVVERLDVTREASDVEGTSS
jgi:16S rRNA (cytosine1402-N4)-methyltransferase